MKRQVLLAEPEVASFKEFCDLTMFYVNQEFGLV